MKTLHKVIVLFLAGMMWAPVIALAAEGAIGSSAAAGYHRQKVVYHINDAQGTEMALKYIQNHLDAVGAANMSVVVVAHGKGIDFLIEEWKDAQGKNFLVAVQNLENQGVEFMACNNTLTARKIPKEKLYLGATIVPSGVATLAELQSQGYVYIKP